VALPNDPRVPAVKTHHANNDAAKESARMIAALIWTCDRYPRPRERLTEEHRSGKEEKNHKRRRGPQPDTSVRKAEHIIRPHAAAQRPEQAPPSATETDTEFSRRGKYTFLAGNCTGWKENKLYRNFGNPLCDD
jgi:hypothetical protein